MLPVKVILCVLIVSHSVQARDTRRGNTRHRPAGEEYKYNHPPAPENYEAIPVAVVYEDESSREDKSIKNSLTSENNVEQVNKEPLTGTSTNSNAKESSDIEVVNSEHFDRKPSNVEQEEPKPTTYRPQKEHQIPVAVVYEPEATYYQKPRPNSNKKRKIQRPTLVKQQTAVEDNFGPIVINGPTGPIATSNKTENLNKRRKIQRPPIPEEKQTIVEEIISSGAQQNEKAPSNLTADKREEFNNKQSIQQPVPKEKQAIIQDDVRSNVQVNEYKPSVPTVANPEDLNKRRKIQRPVVEENQTIEEGNINSSVQEKDNTPSVPKNVKHSENSQEYSKRGNSSRVREVVPIIQSENIVFSHSGNFQYSYEGGDGTKAFEKGELKTFDDDNAGEAVSGGFSYTAKDGNEYSLSYTADENGYRPVGAHLPTPPPIPPAIARALAYLATKTTPEPITESIAEYDQ